MKSHQRQDVGNAARGDRPLHTATNTSAWSNTQRPTPSAVSSSRSIALRDGGTIHANEATRKGGLRRDRSMNSPSLTSEVEVERANDDACMMRR